MGGGARSRPAAGSPGARAPERAAAVEPVERVALGRVVGAHGLRGELRVRYYGDDPENLLAVPEVELEAPSPEPRRAGVEAGSAEEEQEEPFEGGSDEPVDEHFDEGFDERFEVRSARPGRPGEVRLALAGVEDRDAAEALRGRRVTADAEALRPLPEGELYWYQLIGCRVEAEDGRAVGTVRELMETGAHDVLVVEGEDGRTRLVPTARALMKEVDLERRRIVIEALPGLLDPA